MYVCVRVSCSYADDMSVDGACSAVQDITHQSRGLQIAQRIEGNNKENPAFDRYRNRHGVPMWLKEWEKVNRGDGSI